MKIKLNPWQLFFSLNAVELLAAGGVLISLPRDAGGILFGFSGLRLGLLLGMLALAGLLAWAAWQTGRGKLGPFDPVQQRVPMVWALAMSVILSAVCWVTLQVLPALYLGSGQFLYRAVYERLSPLLGWGWLAGIQSALWLGYQLRAVLAGVLAARRPGLKAALWAWGIFGLVGLGIALTRIGLVPDPPNWGKPTIPVMEWQIYLAWAIGGLALVLLQRWGALETPRPKLDLLIGAGIWLAAVVLWLSQPVPPGFFATPGRAPNFEIYPFSDGAFYGQFAQSILIGNGLMGNEIPPRPLFIVFLAALHGLAGQDYTRIITLQTLALAFFPVVVYLLGKEVHSRPAGLAAAALVILRELTSIHSTPFADNVSNTKLFFSDTPTALAVSLLAWAVVRWLKAPNPNRWRPLLVGGLLGVVALIRTQSLTVLLGLLPLSFFVYGKTAWRRWLGAILLLALGLGITVAPWLVRNYQITGRFVFDHPKTQTAVMAQNYSQGDLAELQQKPGEDDGAYTERLVRSIRESFWRDPGRIVHFSAAHFLNNEIANALIFPVRSGLSQAGELIWPVKAFWQDWAGQLSGQQALLLALNLGVIALGIGGGWRLNRLAGLAPLVINLVFNLSTGTGRFSGGRYLLPVDWISYFYFALGLLEICGLFWLALGQKQTQPRQEKAPAAQAAALWPKAVLLAVGFLALGLSVPLAEKVVPARYQDLSKDQIMAALLQQTEVQKSGADLALLARAPNLFAVQARALYPRYYSAEEEEPRTAKAGYTGLPYGRLVFLIVSKINGVIVLRTDPAPAYFPNAADITLVGCQSGVVRQAVLVVVQGPQPVVYYDPQALKSECKVE
jgi:hypothetical protein